VTPSVYISFFEEFFPAKELFDLEPIRASIAGMSIRETFEECAVGMG
jgi:hypothetical protein